MTLLNNPIYIAAILFLLIVFSEWLGNLKYFRQIGSALIVIFGAAILANIHVIPSSRNAPPLYDQIFTYVTPLAIFYLLLDVKLKNLRQAGLPMLSMFIAGSLFSAVGVMTGYHIIAPQHQIHNAFAVAGMYTGTYIGGSANLNAVGLQYDVMKDGTLYAAVNAADNIITTVWIMVTIVLPPILNKLIPRNRNIVAPHTNEAAMEELVSEKEEITVKSISLLLALGFGALFVSNLLSQYIPQIPSILTLTTMGLLLAQIPGIQKLSGSKVMGYFLLLLFLAVIGAYCDINALIENGHLAITLLLWVAIIVLIHGILLFSIGGLFKQDWDIIAIASNANIGGTSSSAVLATSLGRADLRLPAILVGALGNAIGTYAGIMVAELLK